MIVLLVVMVQGVWSDLQSQSLKVTKSKKKRRKWKKKKRKKKHRDKMEVKHVTSEVTVATWEGNDKVGECEVIEVTQRQVKG